MPDVFFLLPELCTNKKTKAKELPFDKMCAITLRKILVKKNKVMFSWKKSKWTKEFAKLRLSLVTSIQRRNVIVTSVHKRDVQSIIENVLDWYCEHIGEQWIPEAFCAASFRKKFIQIQTAYDRWLVNNPQFKIEPKDVMIAKELTARFRWPKGSFNLLPQAVHLTLINFRKFIDELKTHNTLPFVRTILNDVTKSSLYITIRWFERIHNRISNWSNWHGNIMLEAWDGNLENKYLNSLLCDWSVNWSGNTNAWNTLKAKLTH